MSKLFFSYSHRDEDLRDELQIHLTALQRQGVLDTWHDRRIEAGDDFAKTISEHLDSADIILLLISPYFISSNYCFEIEMQHAIAKHEQKQAVVIPVIAHPCDWHNLPFGHLLATPKDGKPISKFPNIHDGFLEVTLAVKSVASKNNDSGDIKPTPTPSYTASTSIEIIGEIRSSNLRVKKSFTDRDKDRFKTEAFEYLAKYFEGSLSELEKRNPEIETNFRRIDANKFCSVIYVNGSEVNRCTIRLGSNRGFMPGITYSSSEQDNSYNECMSIEDDGQMMFLKTLGMSFRHHGNKEQLSLEGAAEYYWSMLIGVLQ